MLGMHCKLGELADAMITSGRVLYRSKSSLMSRFAKAHRKVDNFCVLKLSAILTARRDRTGRASWPGGRFRVADAHRKLECSCGFKFDTRRMTLHLSRGYTIKYLIRNFLWTVLTIFQPTIMRYFEHFITDSKPVLLQTCNEIDLD